MLVAIKLGRFESRLDAVAGKNNGNMPAAVHAVRFSPLVEPDDKQAVARKRGIAQQGGEIGLQPLISRGELIVIAARGHADRAIVRVAVLVGNNESKVRQGL